jgi:hypothetical protein
MAHVVLFYIRWMMDGRGTALAVSNNVTVLVDLIRQDKNAA